MSQPTRPTTAASRISPLRRDLLIVRHYRVKVA
jgi:hypothetical protein